MENKMKNKLLKTIFMLLGVLICFCLVSCGNNSSEAQEEQNKETYTIKVIDLDDEVLGEETILVDAYETIYEALQDKFNVVGEIGQYGAYITSINNSIIDKNYSMMCYVNGVQASEACDKIIPVANDKVEFKNECWANVDYGYGVTMDEIDVLLDKAIYHYIKTTLKQSVESITSFSGGTYWEMLTIQLLKDNGIATNLLSFNYKQELIDSLSSVDLNSLTGVDICKYYTHARVLNQLNPNFSAFYQSVLDNLTTYEVYTTPFVILPNASLKLESNALKNILTTELSKDTTWGPIATLWQYMSFTSNDETKGSLLDLKEVAIDWTTAYEYGSNVDLCTVLMAASCMNQDLRDTSIYGTIQYNDQNLDYVSYILTRFYDQEINLVKMSDSDSGVGYSTNQVYAGLISYKIMRYTGQSNNIFS